MGRSARLRASASPTYVRGTAGAYDAIGAGTLRTHTVQFYEDDAFLVSSVGDFLAAGLALGQPVVVVATPSHRIGLRAHLESRGFDVDRASLRGMLTMADAEELLSRFMDGPLPNPERCRASIGAILRAHETLAPRGTVRVFGEMVDVLCRAGNTEGAIRLEELWNELALTHRFSLLCGYSMRTFADGTHSSNVVSICGAHAHVLPTERYMEANDASRLRDIALLQQRAQSLETEIHRRQELEQSLREALSRAEAANRAKNQFFAVMSHELRTPLNAIGGHVQLVEMELLGPVNAKQRDALARVQRSQRHLLGLINDVLNLAKLEAAQVDYAVEAVPLDSLLAEVTSLLEPLFTTSALACDVICDESTLHLVARGDREKIHQILLNLLGNALKFTPAGGRITLCPRVALRSGAIVEIAVSDTGIGMEVEKLDAIFEPFVQIGGRAAGQKDGVGLGLSISRTLARGMGGNLIADSAPGIGSTFTLSLPRHFE